MMVQSQELNSISPEGKEDYFDLARDEMLDFIPMTAVTILDVGCGVGGFGRNLKINRNVTVWGVESNEKAAKVARTNLDYVVNAEFSPSLDLREQKFDCIVFNDVLEHMYDPWAALRFAREQLSPGGVVVASIPNIKLFSVMWSLIVHDEWAYKRSGVLDITHIRFFTKKEIVRMLQSTGYAVTEIRGINPMPQGRKFRVLNTFFRSIVSPMRYLQFAVVAHSAKISDSNYEI